MMEYINKKIPTLFPAVLDFALLTFNYSLSYYDKITQKMILCERKDTQ